MEETKLLQYFEGKTIFITGATGFLAKIFVEKILRVQPNVKKLFLLIRKTSQKSIAQRLQEELKITEVEPRGGDFENRITNNVDTELFRVIKGGEDFNTIISSKVIPISGDVAYENLGIVDSDLREAMWREIDIVVNSAATTKFDDRYDVAFGINAMGALHVKEFASKCSKLEMLLHVSTAFVHGTRAGLIQEKPLRMGETLPGAEITYLDINTEKEIIEETLRELQSQKPSEKEITRAMKDLGIQRATLHGWPNTYVFTKAMGEMLLENFKEKTNVIILRPTIITSTFKEPFPGWIEGVRTLDSIFAAYGKGKLKFFVGDPESTIDLIPGDMVINCMIAAIAVSRSNDKNELVVYHVGSSRLNPVKYEQVKWLMHRYLSKNPLLDGTGRPIKVGQPITLNTMASFHNYISVHYLPFLKMLKLINMLFWNHFESTYINGRRSINRAVRLAELYKAYLFSQATFDDANTENLRMKIRGSTKKEAGVLEFDPKRIQWDQYFMNTHFFGLANYVLNDYV